MTTPIQDPVSIDKIIEAIKKAYHVVEPFEVYLALKKLKLLHITEPTQDVVRWCIAIQSQRLPITTYLITHLSDRPNSSARSILHRLGDNKILTLLRDERRELRYLLHPRTKEYLDPHTLAERAKEATV